MSDRPLQELAITLPGKQKGDVFVESVVGHEALGQTYAFVVDVISQRPLALTDMIGKVAHLEIRVVDERAHLHGVIGTAETRDPTQNREYCYRFTIEPALAMLRYSAQNQVYGTDKDVTVVDIVNNELIDSNKRGSSTSPDRVSRQIAHDMLAEANSYPKLDFVLQYRESDLNFLCRLCEKFGLFFFVAHGEENEKVVFGDRKEHFKQLSGRSLDENLPFRGVNQIRSRGDYAIRSFNAVYRTESGTVAMREYNAMTPRVDLSVSEGASFEGQGVRVDYGENYRTKAEGEFLARRRVERLEVERLQFHGESNIPLIRPGLFFKLTDHPIREFEQTYVITEVDHRITEQTPVGFSSPDKREEPYSNRFTCIPYNTTFRPALRTPKPVVSGYLVAFVDGAGSGSRAELDEHGRYRVRFAGDESGLSKGKASFLVRKIEPYGGGDGHGSHSTLLKETEIALAFRGGDPDRPVIVGALSNAEMGNTVTSGNQNVAHRTVTTSGIVFEICDGSA